MADNLRTRIADCCGVTSVDLTDSDRYAVADAVIAELKGNYVLVPKSRVLASIAARRHAESSSRLERVHAVVWPKPDAAKAQAHRYVTEWETTDE